MKTALSFVSIIAAILFSIGCTSDKKQVSEIDKSNAVDSVKVDSVKADTITESADTAVVANEIKPAVPETPFSNVNKWEVHINSVTTLFVDITKEEAEGIEDGTCHKYDRYFEEYDAFVNDVDGEYLITYHDDVEVDKKILTKPEIVAKLNKMMTEKKYADYKNTVKIKGNTAVAEWYSGNRGGGIEEDFPEDIKKYLME